MSKPLEFPALAQFVTATAGRNMTKAAYVAVVTGVVLMMLLSIDPAYNALHGWVDALLFACLVFFIFEWVVRLRQAVLGHRVAAYLLSIRASSTPPARSRYRRRWRSAPAPRPPGCSACSGC